MRQQPERVLSAPPAARVMSEEGEVMITIGVDAHKQVHVAVALNAMGREVARWRGANRPEGWQQMLDWAAGLGSPGGGASSGPGTTGTAWPRCWWRRGRRSTRSIPG